MDDVISRQWLMECVNEGWIKFDTEKDENRFIHLVRDIAPSAQPDLDEWCTDCKEYDSERHCCPRYNRVIREVVEETKEERKTGHWMDMSEGFSPYKCSECGAVEFKKSNYCPNCGAKMEGESE